MTRGVRVRVPATTANLGPGFDCLGLALDLWNETAFTLTGDCIKVQIDGHGRGRVATDGRNLVAQAFQHFYGLQGKAAPVGVHIHCRNNIPLGSGLGSSGAASLAGLFAANAFLGRPCLPEEILSIAAELEGHPDNAAAAVLGGLVVIVRDGARFLARRFDTAPWTAAVVVPQMYLPTAAARAALPTEVPLNHTVFNLGRTVLVVEALRSGDADLLAHCMQDMLHQPYRLKLIPGAEAALQAALAAGATAAALSGAGPGLVAFTKGEPGPILDAMLQALNGAGLIALPFGLKTSPTGAQVVEF